MDFSGRPSPTPSPVMREELLRYAILGVPPDTEEHALRVPSHLRLGGMTTIPVIEVHGFMTAPAKFDPTSTADLRNRFKNHRRMVLLDASGEIMNANDAARENEAIIRGTKLGWASWARNDTQSAANMLHGMDALIFVTKAAWNTADMLTPAYEWLGLLDSLSARRGIRKMDEPYNNDVYPVFFCQPPHTQESYDATERFKQDVSKSGFDCLLGEHHGIYRNIADLAIHLTQAIKAHDSAGRQDPDKVIQFLHDHLYEHQRRAGTSPYTSTRPPTSGTSAPTPATVTPGLSLVGKTPAVDDIRTPPIAQTEQLQSSRAFTELAEKRTTPIPPPVPQKSSLRPPIDIAPSRSSSSRGTRREDVPSVQGSARARSAIKGRVSEALAGSSTAPHFPMISPPVSSIDAPPVPPAKDDRSDALSPFKNPRRAPLPPDQLHTLPMPNLDPLMSAQNSPAVPLKQEKLNDAQQVSKEAQAEVDKADKQEKRRTPTTGWWTPKPKADTWKPMRRSMDLFRRKDPEDRMVGAQGNSRGAIERDEVALEEQDISDALDEPVLVPVDQDGRPIESHAVTPLSSNAITPRTGTGIQSQTSTGDRTHSSNKRSRSPEQIEANIAAVLDRMTRRLPSEFRHEARRPSSRNEEYMQDPFKSAPNLPLEPAEPRSHWRWSQTSNLSGVLNFGREGGSENALGMVNMARPARRSSEQTDLPETEEEYTGNGSAEAVMGEEDEGERQEAEEAIGDDGSKQGHSSAWAAHIRGSLQSVRSSESTNETSPQSYGNPFAFDGTVDLHSPQGIEDALGGERDSGYAPSTHSEGQDQGGQAADASSAGLPASPDAPITQPQTPPGPPRIRRPATPDSEDSGYLAANAGETPFTRSRRVLHPDYDDSAQSTVKTILSPVRSPTVREVAPFLSQGMVSGAAAMPTTCPPSSRTGDPQLAGQSRQIGPGTGPRTAVPSHLQPMERPNWFIRTIRDLPFLARFKRSSFRIIREQVPHFPATSTFAATRGVAPPGGTVDSIWAQGATRIEGAPLPLPGVLSPTQAGRSTLDERETAQGLISPTDASARLVRAISEKDEAAKAETSAGQMQATSPMRAKPSKQSTSPSQSTSPIAGPSGTPSHSQSASTRNSAQQVHTRPTPRAFKRISSFSSTTDRGSPVPWHLYPHTEHCESSENDNDTAIAPGASQGVTRGEQPGTSGAPAAGSSSGPSKDKGKGKATGPEVKSGKLRSGLDPEQVRARKEEEARVVAEARENWRNSTLCGLWWSQT